MDLAQLRTFIAAAESGSFASAADIISASASSVTDRIAALEHRLGAALFIRSRRGCALTPAGEGFLPRARSMVSIWDASRTEAHLPARFARHARIGGQYALWPEFLMPWISVLQAEQPDLALSLTAGASARLNRDLAADVLDLAIVYSPAIGIGIEAARVLNDQLVLVRAADCEDWREAWVDIDWGEALRIPIAQVVGQEDANGLRLDIGGMAVRWLIEHKAAGYVPARLAHRQMERGAIVVVPGSPSFDFSAYVTWRSRGKLDTAGIVASLSTFVQRDEKLTKQV